jgi:signal transduction histidine kinase
VAATAYSLEMRFLPLVSLLVFTFGAISFGEVCLFWLRDFRTTARRAGDLVSGILGAVSALWFVLNVASVLADLAHGGPFFPLYTALLFLSALFAPLLMQASYLEHRAFLIRRLWWKAAIAFVWVSAAAAMVSIAATNFLPSERLVIRVFVLLCAMFVVAGVFSALLAAKSKTPNADRDARRHRAADIVLWVFASSLLAFGLFGGLNTVPGGNHLFQLILRSTPLYFLVVGTYYGKRLVFYDLFAHGGALALVALVILTIYFAAVAPLVAAFPIGRAVAWVHAVALLPFIVVTPWLQRRLDEWIDRHWLGRRFSTTEATNYLFAGLQTATTETELVENAQSRLSEIFQAPAHVTTAVPTTPPIDGVVLDIPIEFQHEEVGRIRLGRRRGGLPYLSQDVSLLDSLSDLISSMLTNVRLQARRREHETCEQELRLHATRSELKALRAQINPHFLFNALNAIIALIPKDPGRAEDTLEQLAEVFRYTLTRSDKEWTRLADEAVFVRAYLDVERARFGDRLQATLDIDSASGDVKVPSMMLQTLVENAVKHGLSSVRGVGVLSIEARTSGDRLRLVVRDNGPGLEAGARDLDAPPRPGQGYGLRNIRERLRGYFGDQAAFVLSRDAHNSTTVASVELPLTAPLLPSAQP